MPPTCRTCKSPKRAEIDKAIVAGTSTRLLATRYGTSQSAISRHRPHASASIVRAAAREGEKLDDSLLAQMRGLQARTLALLDDAEDSRDGRLRAVAISQVRENVQLLAKLTGELNEAPKVAIVLAWGDSAPGAPAPLLPAAPGEAEP